MFTSLKPVAVISVVFSLIHTLRLGWSRRNQEKIRDKSGEGVKV